MKISSRFNVENASFIFKGLKKELTKSINTLIEKKSLNQENSEDILEILATSLFALLSTFSALLLSHLPPEDFCMETYKEEMNFYIETILPILFREIKESIDKHQELIKKNNKS